MASKALSHPPVESGGIFTSSLVERGQLTSHCLLLYPEKTQMKVYLLVNTGLFRTDSNIGPGHFFVCGMILLNQ